ncbi:MerR family DNA-binding transcriptional regulator [Pseudonocardia sp. ICBG601]|uniref:MerR family DNA-binding transcriptional regulator n=1 Tax=Pseudonocardia sp. ICBG601 TaxID=2846759 RepID=UPI001CF6C51E|nr:MerR family DNA-binding transcriptional regulator [Pseudonocardia sp. ICBG601]
MTERETLLVGTWAAARAIGVDPKTLRRWADAGLVTPADETLGGHLRWNVTDLRMQVQRIKAERRAYRRAHD